MSVDTEFFSPVSGSIYLHCVLCLPAHRLVGHWAAVILDSERFLECFLASRLGQLAMAGTQKLWSNHTSVLMLTKWDINSAFHSPELQLSSPLLGTLFLSTKSVQKSIDFLFLSGPKHNQSPTITDHPRKNSNAVYQRGRCSWEALGVWMDCPKRWQHLSTTAKRILYSSTFAQKFADTC